MTSRYEQALADPPHASDQPDAVRGPWRAVLHACGDVIPTDQWFGDEGDTSIAIVRDTALPVDNGASGERMPDRYRDSDVLYRFEDVEEIEDLEARWAQARLVAALLNANQEKLDAINERQVPA